MINHRNGSVYQGGADKKERPPVVTTLEMIHERAKMFCPRLGDSYARAAGVADILEGESVHCAAIVT